MKYVIIAILMTISHVEAADWFCSEEASARHGSTISACGIASSPDESQARAKALENALYEFKSICKSSSDCKGHSIAAEPKRTSCEQHGGIYKCTRLVEYTIGRTIVHVVKQKTVEDSFKEEIHQMMVGNLRSQGFSESDIKEMIANQGI